MALLLERLFKFYTTAMRDWPDPRTQHFFLIKYPVNLIIILGVYFLFCLKYGPKFMKNREPFNIKKFMIAYNILQILCNASIIILGTQYAIKFSWHCHPNIYKYADDLYLSLGYLYLLIKILDAMDTVFFVLKKNFRQLTFLHMYHHGGMILLIWLGVKYYPDGYSMYMAYINSFVHTVMYSYYLLCTINDEHKNNIWWKKYITQLQIVQFGLLFIIYFPLLFRDCSIPKAAVVLFLINNGVITVLFLDFYYKTYLRKDQ